MAQAKLTDNDFVAMFERLGAAEMARKIGQTVTSVYARRERLERKIGRQIVAPSAVESSHNRTRVGIAHPHKAIYEAKGTVIVFSDAHYWPNIISTAHKALLKMIRELQPTAIVANGDVFDGASISRHPPIGWESRPSVIQEIETCQARLNEIEAEAKNAKLIWTLGNHDGRFETRLATVAPEFAKVHGTHLRDFFPVGGPLGACGLARTLL